MLFHASISATDPERVARFIAAVWQGEAFPFPPAPGGWIALANDDRASAIEVNRFGLEMEAGDAEVQYVERTAPSPTSTSHQAIATSQTAEAIEALAAREGWKTLRCWRGAPDQGFGVIEVWLENRILVEVLTPEMQRQYLHFLRPGAWPEFLKAVGA